MNHSKIAVIATVSSLLTFALAQPGPAAYPADLKPTHADLAYASTSKAQTLDLFVPQGNGPFPLVVNIHGGGFMAGSKEMLDAPIARALLKEGVAVASINYRLSGEARFPAAVLDAKAAVRFLRANAARYRLNPDRFLAFGQSAGGNLASLLGTSGGVAAFEDPALGNAGTSSRVQGVIDWFGPTDFLQMDAAAKAQGCPADHGQANSPESKYLGKPIAEVPELVRQANPITYIDSGDPPFLLQKGDKDCLIPFAQSQLLHDALRKAGVAAALETLAGAGHGGAQFSTEANVRRVVEFVKATLK
ncbi:MAG: alpha/beta hydrolase [Meiothermus sp.]|nr:alpha/beta hydrolase [Meiothermus sp.]